ncbi:MAG: ABC transporter ATP-binding protein/permease [Ghiorsea sp.]
MSQHNKFSATSDTDQRNHWQTLLGLASYLWPQNRSDLRIRVVIAIICLVFAKVINVYVPFFYKDAVDALSIEQTLLALPLGLILAYGSARILSQFFGELRDFIFIRVAQYAKRAIGLTVFKHLHDLSLRFHLERQTGGLSRVIERGTAGIQFILGFTLFNILPTLLEILLVTGVLFYTYDAGFALVTFFTISTYIAFTLLVTEWRLKFRKVMNQKDSEANTKSIDSLLNYETVKYFGNEKHEYQRFESSLAGYETAAIKGQESLSLLNVGQGAIIGVGLVVVMLMAAQGVVDGRLSIGDFVLVNTFLIQLYLPLNFLGFVYGQIRQSLIDMDKMFELLDVHTEIQDLPEAKSLNVAHGEIKFENVDFSYTTERSILKNISFNVAAGHTTAIVGPSGSGKSTISRLLFRFYDINSGSIKIDGQNIDKVQQDSLRKAIGIVPQDTVLFNDSIAYNILYGCPEKSEDDMIKVAKMAHIHDFILSLPDGYQTVVGERGLKLSGGEKQRIAIARTILKDPAILLFDEATSALDSNTEKEIQVSLYEVSKGRTTLVIAHRLSTIVNVDEILVLKAGEIIEKGNHHQLLKQNGEYALMWQRQQQAQTYEMKLNKVLSSPSS